MRSRDHTMVNNTSLLDLRPLFLVIGWNWLPDQCRNERLDICGSNLASLLMLLLRSIMVQCRVDSSVSSSSQLSTRACTTHSVLLFLSLLLKILDNGVAVVAIVDAIAESDNLILLCLGQNTRYVTLELKLVLSRDEGLLPFAAVEANHPRPQRFKNNVEQ